MKAKSEPVKSSKSDTEDHTYNVNRKEELIMNQKIVNKLELQDFLQCSRKLAIEIGCAAGAQIQSGRRFRWNLNRIEEYFEGPKR